MRGEFCIRRLRADDDAGLRALDARTRHAYRDEDAGAVAAMHQRALEARAAGVRWSPLPSNARDVPAAEHRAFWVATPLAHGSNEIIGSVGLGDVGKSHAAASDLAECSGLPAVAAWMQSGDVGEVRHLRVAPDWRRRGVATALMRELISWSTFHGKRSLVLNTTAAQMPALGLYRRLGFGEVGRSYLDVYELVWMQMVVSA